MIEITIDTKSPYKTIKYLKKLNINIYNIKYYKDKITLKISLKELNKVSKFYKYKITKKYGINYLKEYIKINLIPNIYLILIILTIYLITRITINIEVITNKENIRTTIINELYKNNITKYTIIKNDKELSTIKEKILNNNKDLLEWLNIKRVGMRYIINLEPKVVKNKLNKNKYCNIISTKDALVTRIITHKGVELISQNDLVSKDTILISGDIKYNEELKKQVCAQGIVYGKTWYTINIKIPTNYEKTIIKDKTRYNILLKYNNKKYKLLKPRINNYKEINKRIINIFGLEIYLQKNIQINKKITKYTNQELEKLLETKINNTLSHILKGEYKVLDRKVLKKHINNSKIELEVFIVAEEQISTINYIKE